MNLALDRLPETFEVNLPPFSTDGLIPPGDYAPSGTSFRERFVEPTERRVQIFEGWSRHRQALLDAGLPEESRQLLNGSYCTQKPDPGDLDIAVEVPTTRKDLQQGSPVFSLLQGPATKATFHCDAYAIPCLPKSDPDFVRVTVEAIRYWSKWFAQTRDGKIKGRVWTRSRGLP